MENIGVGIAEEIQVLVGLVLSLYNGSKTRVRMDYNLSEEFYVKVGKHKRSVLSPFLMLW